MARRWKSILVVAAITVAVTMVITFVIAPAYQSTASLSVQPLTNNDPLGYANGSEMSARNYGELIKSPTVAARAAKALGVAELGGTPEYRVLENSGLLQIIMTAKSPQAAADEANAIAEAFIATNNEALVANADRVAEELDVRLSDLRNKIAATQKGLDAARKSATGASEVAQLQDQLDSLQTAYQNVLHEIQVLPANQAMISSALLLSDRAVPQPEKVSPKPALNLVLALAGGLLLGVAYARATEPRVKKHE